MAEARQRERWGHTVTLVQGVFLAFVGKCPKAEEIAPPGVLGVARKKPRPKTEAEQAAEMEFTGRFMEQAFLAVG
jgi:hypothetical protein